MNDLYSFDFTRCLPPFLKNDPKMIALAQSIADQLKVNAQDIHKNIIYARIDELDEKMLDILAYDLHVDWYDYSYPLEVKRQTIKDSVKIHRKLGTKYAVETAIGAMYPETKVKEWFEYGGKPYMFKIVLGIDKYGVSIHQQNKIVERVQSYKNLRSHLEAISYQTQKHAIVQAGAVHSIGTRLEIYPYLTKSIESTPGGMFYAGFVRYTRTLEIFPNKEQNR